MQQVDLLVAELRPRRERLSLGQVWMGWGGFVLVLLLVSSWQGFGVWRLGAERAAMEAELQQLAERNEHIRASFDPAPAPELVTEVETLRRLLETQALLVGLVQELEATRTDGFAGHLRDLATQHVDGIALTRIALHDGGSRVLLTGETDAAVNVPKFLQRLSEGESFRGQRFDQLRLEAQESGLIRFQIEGPDSEHDSERRG